MQLHVTQTIDSDQNQHFNCFVHTYSEYSFIDLTRFTLFILILDSSESLDFCNHTRGSSQGSLTSEISPTRK